MSELSCHSLIIGKIHYNHNIQFTMKSFCFIYTVTISCLLCWTQFSLAVIGYNVWTLCCDLIMKWKKLCVDDSVALTGGCYTFVSKWTYMCMLWKFAPCFSWYHMAEIRAFFSFLSFWRCTLWPKPCPNTQTSRSAWPQVGDVIYLFICHLHLSIIYLL